MDTIEKQLHIASQYLAAAGISFLPKKEDDSHTNLGFNPEEAILETHSLSDANDKLILNYKNFSLEWRSDAVSKVIDLDGATHKGLVEWISSNSREFINKEYSYKFHYELPYSIDDDFTFKLSDVEDLSEMMHLRILAQFILERIDIHYNLNTSIRIWPHHFDTGIYSLIPDLHITVGLGLAIPDSLCENHYLYITGYKGGQAIDPSGLESLTIGDWKSNGFKGAILDARGIVEADGVKFFKEVISQLQAV
ncbi:hypothetical protein [Dokdonia sp. PRO95]|uniref:hypothetical protein n=1 Tax=Dokdonia sp. PRO95 TaxID=1239415 RepID=UPI00054D42C0|nr:hypothetical protein [Dokdonia sp. PRO95]